MKYSWNKNIILKVSVFAFTICMSLLLTNITDKIITYNEDKIIYSRNAKEIQITSMENNIELSDLNNLSSSNFSIIKNYLERTKDVRGIYYKGESKIPIESGRFFSQIECLDRTRKTVVGHILLENAYEMNGREYIKIKDNEFEIIGLIKSNVNENYDRAAFISIRDAVDLFGIPGQYALDGNLNDVNDVVKDLMKYKGIEVLQLETNWGDNTVRFFNTSNEIIYIYLLLLISLILLIAAGINYWLYSRKNELYIYKILGFSDKYIFSIYIKNCLINVFPVTTLGILFVLILLLMHQQHINLFLLIGYSLISNLICIFIVAIILIKELHYVKVKGNETTFYRYSL